MIFVLSMNNSLLALYTKLNGDKYLIYIGREGSGSRHQTNFSQMPIQPRSSGLPQKVSKI